MSDYINTTVKKICLEMLEQRHYNIIREKTNSILALKPDGEQMCVFFDNSNKLNKQEITKYISKIKSRDIRHCIIIYKDSITSSTKTFNESCSNIQIELKHVNDLMFNITKHRLQPKRFTKVDDTSEFDKEYIKKIPIMKEKDPICLFYNYKKNDLIEIQDRNDVIYYRLVK